MKAWRANTGCKVIALAWSARIAPPIPSHEGGPLGRHPSGSETPGDLCCPTQPRRPARRVPCPAWGMRTDLTADQNALRDRSAALIVPSSR